LTNLAKSLIAEGDDAAKRKLDNKARVDHKTKQRRIEMEEKIAAGKERQLEAMEKLQRWGNSYGRDF
jgi:hypothetical protein